MFSENKEFNELIHLFFSNKGIISIWGDYGVGKTTFSLQMALDTAFKEKTVIYIYTKPNFPYEKINNFIQDSNQKILNNINFIQSLNFEDLYSLVFNLEFIVLDKNTRIELIIVDSITDLYRIELNRENKEKNFLMNYKLSQILANLSYLNKTYNIDILIVNNKTYIDSNGQIIEVQSGGLVMEYWINSTIKIIRTNKLNQRKFIFNTENKEIIKKLVTLTKNGFS
ncbi:MAG: hypothetical protein ACFFFB_06605 [Candidatus Heimdallarchaeota archaeon]